MQECRKEMPVEDDYMMVIIPCIAEIAASDTPERVKKLRFGAVSELQRYLHYYRQLGYMPKLLYAIADKKCRMIVSATTKAEMQKLVRPNCPHYDGAGFIPDAYSVPEEELICWSETSLKGPLTAEGFQRYMELFMMVGKPSPNQTTINNLTESQTKGVSGGPSAPYGRYGNIFLSQTEYDELQAEYPDRLERFIEEMSRYLAANGKSYQNYAAALRIWAENDKKDAPKQGVPDYTCKEGESL